MRILSIEHFAPHAGTACDLDLGTATMALTLSEVAPLPGPVPGGALRAPFHLVFRSASPVVLPQRIYTLRHPALGSLGLFLVPVMRGREGIVYQAVFN